MVRAWGATGAGEICPPRLRSSTKEQIELILNGRNVPQERREEFFESIASAVGFFDSNKGLREKSKPSSVRKNLQNALTAARRLADALVSLDGNSCLLLHEGHTENIQELRAYSRRIVGALQNARRLADEYPGKASGNLPENERLFLAADVADAMERILGLKPTTTRENLYEALLEVVLMEATGKKVKAVHNLARRALSYPIKRVTPDGPVEYVPPPQDD